MWFTDPGSESVGRVTPSGEITEYRIPLPPKGDYRTGTEGYLVPSHIVAVPGGLVFTEDDAKALGLIEPFASLSSVAHPAVTIRRSQRPTHKGTCAHTNRNRTPTRRMTYKKVVCRRSRDRQ